METRVSLKHFVNGCTSVPLSIFFQKILLTLFVPPSSFGNFVFPPFYWSPPPPTKMQKDFFHPSDSFKLLLLGC